MSTFEIDDDIAEITEPDAPKDLSAELKRLQESLKARDDEVSRLRKAQEDEAERAYKASIEATDSKQYAAALEHTALAQTRSSLEARQNILKSEMAKATEMADGARMAELAVELGELSAQLVTVRHGLQDAERNVERSKDWKRPEPPKRQVSSDPFDSEQFRNLPSASQEWLRQHKDKGYLSDRGLSPKAMKAYWDAVDAGLNDQSPTFYEHMDRVLGHNTSDDGDEGEAPEPPRQRQQQKSKSSMAAPVSRSGSDSGPVKPGRGFRLKGEYVATAERLGMTPDEYVQYAYEATKNGSTQQRAEATAFYNRIRG